MTAAQLTQIAHSTQWVFPPRQAADFQPAPDPDDPAAAYPPVPVEQTLATLKKVLPANVHLSQPKTWTGGFNGASYVVNASSIVTTLVQIDVPRTACEDERGYVECTVRGDGCNAPQTAGATPRTAKPWFSVEQLLGLAGAADWKFPGTQR